jgi:hypothetical protein
MTYLAEIQVQLCALGLLLTANIACMRPTGPHMLLGTRAALAWNSCCRNLGCRLVFFPVSTDAKQSTTGNRNK